MITNFLANSTKFLLSFLLFLPIGVAVADDDSDSDSDRKRRQDVKVVDCTKSHASIQRVVDRASRKQRGGETTILIEGTCTEDVTISNVDDITLSGNAHGDSCSNPGGTGTINGTVTVDGVRARIEFLTITGSGEGVNIVNRADAHLVCNDISNNEATGVSVVRTSNAVLRHNRLSGNGTRTSNPFIFFDCGLFAGGASSVNSRGNTYTDNQYCAIEIDRQSAFRNGAFLPRAPGNPASPADRDVIVERGCDPASGAGCFTTDEGPVAIEVFNGGLVDLRNALVGGEIESHALSSFRVDGNAVVQGNISNRFGSVVRIVNRGSRPCCGDRSVSYTGALSCADTSQTYFSNVECGQMCSGPIPGSCAFQCSDGIDNDGDGLIDFGFGPGPGFDPECAGPSDASGEAFSPPSPPSPPPPPLFSACSDGIDNDGDGLIDFGFGPGPGPGFPGFDPECSSPADNDEMF